MRIVLFMCVVASVAVGQTASPDSLFVPQNLHIASSAPQSVTIEWNRVDNATGYRVWYGFSSDNLDYAGDTPVPAIREITFAGRGIILFRGQCGK